MKNAALRTRTERDTFGPIQVPAERLWGAQTQRSLEHFRISGERMPLALVRALALVKKAVALVHVELGVLDAAKGGAIAAAADEVLAGRWDDEFPLVVWQTGSGTQTNMNVNEVLANRASEILGGERGEKRLVHPNDDVNRGQSTNDAFPTAIHVATVEAIRRRRRPRGLAPARHPRREGGGVPGRRQDRPHAPHGRDAPHPRPGDLGLGGPARPRGGAPRAGAASAAASWPSAATAVGTGLNAHPELAARAAARLAAGHRPPLRHRAEQVRGPRLAGRARLRPRRPPDGGGLALQDRERRAVAGLRPPQRARRDRDPRERAGQLDHAGQGQPDAGRGADHGRRPGHGQRRGGGRRRDVRELRAQRLHAGDRAQRPARAAA